MSSVTHALKFLAAIAILSLLTVTVPAQNRAAKADNKITPIFNVTKTTSGERLHLVLSVANANGASVQQIRPGDSFTFTVDATAVADFELENEVQVRSSSLSPADFRAAFNTATGEIKITYTGDAKIFAYGDSFGVELSLTDASRAITNSVTVRGVTPNGATSRYNDFKSSSLDIEFDDKESQSAKFEPHKFFRAAKGGSLVNAVGSEITTYTFDTTINPRSVKRARFNCPAGQFALNGGFTILGADQADFNLGAFGNRAVLTSNGPGLTDTSLWAVVMFNSTDNALLGKFYFMCAPR